MCVLHTYYVYESMTSFTVFHYTIQGIFTLFLSSILLIRVNSFDKKFLTCCSLWIYFCSVQFSCSIVSNTETPWITVCQASLSITNTWSSLKRMSIELVMPSSYLILCCSPLLLPPVLPDIRVFSNESTLRMREPKYWSFSFSISPSNEHPGLISFRMDWLDLLAVQGTLKSLLQHHSAKASILRRSAFFIVQLSQPYVSTWEDHSLD